MRRLLLVFSFLLILSSTFQSSAQNTATYHKKWLFGMNWGGAWENADVHSRLGTGWGLTLEKEIIANNTSLFGFSLRGRYLHTWMWGRESTPFYGVANDNNLNGVSNPSINYTSAGYVYRNFYTKTDEFSLEGLLILNRLRANSGFKIYGFGGIGATGYLSKINQLDGAGNMYDYSSVSNFSKGIVKNDLNNLWDKSYETNGVAGQNKSSYVLSGAIGIGIGIKLSPNVYLGWEHKYTYTSTDNLDASKFKIDGTKSLKNDRYHYSSLFLTVAIGSGSSHVQRTPQQTTYYSTPTQDPKPAITLLYPHENPVYLQECLADIKVSITNVASVNQITVLRDGNVLSSNYYSFDAETQVLAIHTPISGNTVFSIVAQNSSGKDTKYVYTNCVPVLMAPAPVAPIVSIMSSSSTNCIANVVASVKNVTDSKSIEVIMDGIILSSQQYHFNPYNGSVVVEAPFYQFTSITIRATSSGNSAVQTVNLSCTPVKPLGVPNTMVVPVINVLASDVDIDNNSNCTARIRASVSGVNSISMISVTRNGVIVNPQNYSFDSNTGILTIANAIIGANTFLIKTSNALGATTASVSVDCAGQLPKVPVIQLVQPTTYTYSSVTCREHIALKVLEITDIQNINVTINGVAISKNLMRFDPKFSLLTFDALITRETIIIASATNKDGTATEKLTINCAPILAPTISIGSPSTDPFVSKTCQETVVASVTDITDINSIHVTLNGIVLTTGLSYDGASKKLTFPVNVSGRSEILINAVGKGGSASKSLTIICQPSPKPVITVISPTSDPYVSSACQEQVSVQIQNITSIADVSVALNGVPVASSLLNYNAITSVLVFPVQFSGTALVVVKATNVNDVTLQTLSLQCKPIILPKPTIQLIAPIAISTISKTCRESVKLQLTNCATLTDISVLENGVPIKSELLTYLAATGILSFEVSVVATSTFVVSAKNNGGTSSTTLTIQCKPTILPSVSILEPIGSPIISTECLENIKAVVKNVPRLDQIEVTYNGTSVNRSLLFYDTLTSTLTFSHAFNANGDLVIKASNETGQDSKTVSLICKPVVLPELVIVSPKQDPYTSEKCKDTIVASVKNIESIDAIAVFANNVKLPSSTILFDKAAGLIRVVVTYTVNTEVKFIVENSAGLVSKTIHLTCNPVLQPVINLMNPTTETFVSQTCQENILMNIVNISAIDQIQVKVNSTILDQTLYTFVASTGLLTIPITCSTPTKVEVLVTNKTKTATKTINLTCNKLPLPSVVINTPSTETSIIDNCSTTIKATVTNVTVKEQLIITNNGKAVNAATYSFIDGIVIFAINVTDRAAINITATNATGAASDIATLICDAPKVISGPTGKTCDISPTPITNCTSCNDTITIANGDIIVNANQKVCMPNSFTGSVTMNGGQLVICGNATIHNINFNSGDIVITGNATFDNLNMNNSESAIRNYGTVKFSNITFNGRFENHGQATISSDFNVNSSALFINTGTLNASMNFNNNNFVCNSGTITVGGNLKDNGSAEFTNSCKLSVGGQLQIDQTFTNSGVVSVGSVTFVNGLGILTLAENSKWLTTDIVINGSINGPSGNCALVQIKNDTRINGGASLTGKIDVCDINGIELTTGSISSSVTTDCSCSIKTSGVCSSNEDLNAQIIICHKPVGNATNPQTLTISKSALAAHLAHGDHVGVCTSADVTVQNPAVGIPPLITPPIGVSPIITPPVAEEKITICHMPLGNATNIETITISRSALSSHLAHGDHVGVCTNADMTVAAPPAVTPPVSISPVYQESPYNTSPSPVTVRPIMQNPTNNPATTTPIAPYQEGSYNTSPPPTTATPTMQNSTNNPATTAPIGPYQEGSYNTSLPPVTATPAMQNPTNNPATTTPVAPYQEGSNNTSPPPVTAPPVMQDPNSNPATTTPVAPYQEGSNNTLTPPVTAPPVMQDPNSNPTTITPVAPYQEGSNNTSPPPVTVPPVMQDPNSNPATTTPVAPYQETMVTICHKNPDGTRQTLTVSQSEVQTHLAHGDSVGVCTPDDMNQQ